jgi:hypothetical protein
MSLLGLVNHGWRRVRRFESAGNSLLVFRKSTADRVGIVRSYFANDRLNFVEFILCPLEAVKQLRRDIDHKVARIFSSSITQSQAIIFRKADLHGLALSNSTNLAHSTLYPNYGETA